MRKMGSPAPLAGGNRARIGYVGQRPDTAFDLRGQYPGRMRLRKWRPIVKGALRGLCEVELLSGLILHDVAIFAGRNGSWASLPSKPFLDQDGC